MSTRIKITDIARHADVSAATVDRVLHGRGGYSASSAERVVKAIDELGYGRFAPHFEQFRKKILTIAIFLPSLPSSFRQSIEDAARLQCNTFGDVQLKLKVRYTDLIDGADTIANLEALDSSQFDAVCLFAVDAPGVREAINRTVNRGIEVCTIVSDVPASNRSAYVGLDNVAAGRTAGRLISRIVTAETGKIGVITGSHRIRDHTERYMGLTQVLAHQAPQLTLLPALEGQSYNDKNKDLVRQLFEAHDDLVALYSIAGGSAGVIEGLRQYQTGPKPVVVVHELEPVVREALLDGTVDVVINQNRAEMIRGAFQSILQAVEGRSIESQMLVSEIFLAENLP